MSTHALSAPLSRPSALVRWIAGGVVAAVVIVAIAIAVWPASEADKARADGKQVGQAVNALYYADTTEEADAALTDLQTAVADTADHAGDYVYDQVNRQADALNRAVDGYIGSRTTDDGFEADLYQAELDTAIDDLNNQADDFQTEGPEVQQAFWDGVDSGLNGE
jgi:hypothetical protein